MPTLKKNKQGLFNYRPLEEFEAGLQLLGWEVKSVKKGNLSLKGSYITLDKNNNAWLVNAYVSPYQPAGDPSLQDNNRQKRLLLKRKELDRLKVKLKEEGLTIIPISVYTKGTLVKIKIALAKGKSKKDKREIITSRETDRNIQRMLRNKI